MGGCCCCESKTAEINNSPPFYQNPRVSEEHEPLSSHCAAVSGLSTGLLVDPNLDTSIPDTYRPPPAPIPYETVIGRPSILGNQEGTRQKGEVVGQTTPPTESIDHTNSVSTLDSKVKNLDSNEKVQINNNELEVTKQVEDKKADTVQKSIEVVTVLEDEEDVCPTCLEEYDSENPRIITKCDHHFHLACILEWMERSETCPICDQTMVFSPVIG